MFLHNFKYTLKILFKNKSLIFWTFAFPIILGLFFNMAFKDIESSEKLETIDIAVIQNENLEKNKYFKEALDSLGKKEDEDRLFNIEYTDLNRAKNLLEEDKISGYIHFEDSPYITVKKSGINETVIKTVVDEITEYSLVIESLVAKSLKNNISPEEIPSLIENELKNLKENAANIKDESNTSMSYTMIEYYTLIAMSCLYGGIISMYSIMNLLANISNRGKRVSITPTKKRTLVLSSLLASYITQILGLILLFIFLLVIVKVDFGEHLLEVLMLSLTGSLAGLSFGIFIGINIKTNENAKTGMLLAFIMLGCFFSGMMGITMKYIIDSNVPIINILNPANMITDAFYALYYYGISNKYIFDMISLLIFTGILMVVSILGLRRQKYDNI